MLVLGIDPGSIKTGWAVLKIVGNKTQYVASGILVFDQKTPFMQRLAEIQIKVRDLIQELKPDEVALESLIYVKSPTALIKLAQTRGIILGELLSKCPDAIFEYSPNLVKSSAIGHGHANKESVEKVITMMFGKREYASHDETDAIAVALCHIINRNTNVKNLNGKDVKSRKSSSRGLAGALAHKLR